MQSLLLLSLSLTICFTLAVARGGNIMLTIPDFMVNVGRKNRYLGEDYLIWKEPKLKDYSLEWKYTVQAQYFIDGQIKHATLRNKSSLTMYDSTDKLLLPCTDYNIWVSGDGYRVNKDRYNRIIGKSFIARAMSRRLLVATKSSVPIKKPQVSDIQILVSKSSAKNCSARISWTPTDQLFGCPVLGFSVFIKTRHSWPDAREYKTAGFNYTLNGLNESTPYPIMVKPYNRYGSGAASDYFFLKFTQEAPPAPINVKMDRFSCWNARISWDPPHESRQLIKKYDIEMWRNGSIAFRNVTDHPYNGFKDIPIPMMGPGAGELRVTAVSDWGSSEPVTIMVNIEECQERSMNKTII